MHVPEPEPGFDRLITIADMITDTKRELDAVASALNAAMAVDAEIGVDARLAHQTAADWHAHAAMLRDTRYPEAS